MPQRAMQVIMPCTRALAEAMEDRILHSADVAPLLFAGAAAGPFLNQPMQSAGAGLQLQRSEIAFVDATLPDAAELLGDLQAQRAAGRPIEIISIAAGEDGLAVVSATLAARQDVTAVHVLVHGSQGELQLGSTTLDASTLLLRAREVAGWAAALGADADILLYGCDLAQTVAGQSLVRDLSGLTGADVAASTDLTGAAQRGGDWILEYRSGDIESALAPSARAQSLWQGILATYTVTTTVDQAGGGLAGSLRWAVKQSNANPGADTIVFAVNGNFSMVTSSGDDDQNGSGDYDVNDSVAIVGNGTSNTIVVGNGSNRVFDLRGGTVDISGMTIQGGKSSQGGGIRIGLLGTASLTDVVVQGNVGSGASEGAGIHNQNVLTLRNVVVQNNGDTTSGNADGAGVYNAKRAQLDARNVEFRNNISAGNEDGGGLAAEVNGIVKLENVTFAGNQAARGGGMWNNSTNSTLTNVTFSGNTATVGGGGLWASASATLDHVTVAFNSAPTGGGAYDGGSKVLIRSSLFALNSGGNTNIAPMSQGYNLSDDSSPGFTGTGDRKNLAAGLLPLANNGGFTRTHAIGADSAARNAADPATTLSADQRGIAYSGGRADIGAYEFNPFGAAPTISAVANQTIDEDMALGPLAFGVDDPETPSTSLVVTASSSNTALVPNANIVLGGTASNRTVSLTPLPNANSSANGGSATITLSVSDGGNITTSSFVVTVLAINDAPTITLPAAQSVAEDATLTLAGASAPRVGDVDAGSAPIQLTLAVAQGLLTLSQTSGLSFSSGTGSNNASMTFTGSQAAINAALAGLQYRPNLNFNGADQLNLSVNDLGNSGSGGALTSSASLALTVTAVNDAPTIALAPAQTVSEDVTLTLVGANAPSIADSDAGEAALQATLDVANGRLSLSQITGLAFLTGTGSNDASMSFSGTRAAINSALAGLQYRPNANYTGADQLNLGVDDLGNTGSGGARTASASMAITVTAVNDAPTVSLPPAQTVNEDGTLTLVGASAPSIADSDAGGAALQVTLDVANGRLSLSQTTGLAFVTGTGTDNASMSFSGTQAAINAALAGLQYRPNANYNGADQLNLSVNDLGNTGSGGARITNANLALSVTAVNDAPTLGLPGPQVAQLLTPMVFSAASGNAITVADLDAGSSVIEVTLSTVAQGNGTLTLGSTAGLTMVVGNGTPLLVLRGSQSDLNAALDTLSFSATLAAPAQIDVSTDDLGNSGSGGALQSAGAVAITVSSNAAPTLTLSRAAVAFNENDPALLLDPALTVNDSDDATLASAKVRISGGFAGAQDVLAFTAVPATMGNIVGSYSAGLLSLSSAGASATLAEWQTALRSITYVNTSDAPSSALRTVTLTINDNTSDSATRSLSINVAAVNDAPVLTGANNLAPIAEDTLTNAGTLVSSLIAGHITDLDSAAQVGIAVTGADNTNGSWRYTIDGGSNWFDFGAVNESSARLLAANSNTSIFFMPNANWNGSVINGLSFRAWDQSSGTPGVTANASVNGGSTAFSTDIFHSSVTVTPVNDVPALTAAIADQSATQDAVFSFSVPAGSFVDVDTGDTLVHSATLASGAALPSWLSFDAATRTFSGTPRNADVAALAIRVTATDSTNASVFDDFNLDVANLNDSPVGSPIADQIATQGTAFRFAVPGGTFTDADAGDALVYTARLPSGAALPSWLSFDGVTQTFSGTPGNADVGGIVIRMTATDSANAAAFDDFNLVIANSNDAPVGTPIANQRATQDMAFSFMLPAGSFSDIDTGDTLTFAAGLQSGAALPAWLSFDALTQTFSGTPDNFEVGNIAIRVTASDSFGAQTFQDFDLDVANVNEAPLLTAVIVDRAVLQDVALSFTLPPDTFSDSDIGIGDALGYVATLASGAPLPAWLAFDAGTQTFSGAPGNAEVGTIAVRVTATDSAGAAAFGDFSLTVTNTNDAPVLSAPLPGQTALSGLPLQFQVPSASFSDPDLGDTLRYSATLADGSALPQWLSFDQQTRSFSGNPSAGDTGTITVRVTASDDAGAGAQAHFAITVSLPASASGPAEPAGPVQEPALELVDLAPQQQPPAAPTVAQSSTAPPSPAAPGGPSSESLAEAATAELVASEQDGLVQGGAFLAAGFDAPVDGQRRDFSEPGNTPGAATRFASQADAVLADIAAPQFNNISVSTLSQLMRSDELARRFEEMQRRMLEQGETRRSAIASTVVVTGGVSIGYVVWLVRGGVLMSSMLSALPAWQMIDPLPVLAASRAGKGARNTPRGDDADVERLFDERSRKSLPAAPAPAAPVALPEPAAQAESKPKRSVP